MAAGRTLKSAFCRGGCGTQVKKWPNLMCQ